MRRILLVLVAAVLVGVSGCGGASSSGTATTVKLMVVRTPYGVVVGVDVPVTIGDRTYTFVLDSGAARTVVDRSVADAMGLREAAPPTEAYGIGCPIPTEIDRVGSWSLGDRRLAPAEVAVQSISAGLGKVGGHPIDGLLGADVLSSFGSVHLDYQSQTLTLGAVPPPGEPAITLSTAPVGDGQQLFAMLSVGSSPTPVSVLIDTGSAKSYLATPTAARLGIQPAGPEVTIGTPGCKANARLAPVSGAKLGSVPIPLQQALVGPSQLYQHDPKIGAGLIGEDVLGFRRSAWLDFTDHKLVLR